jgi:hypothetical protein
MRVGHAMKLIDLDASAAIGIDYSCAKFSSAYLPPECFHYDEASNYICVKGFNKDIQTDRTEQTRSTSYDMVLASPHHDIWALGLA